MFVVGEILLTTQIRLCAFFTCLEYLADRRLARLSGSTTEVGNFDFRVGGQFKTSEGKTLYLRILATLVEPYHISLN